MPQTCRVMAKSGRDERRSMNDKLCVGVNNYYASCSQISFDLASASRRRGCDVFWRNCEWHRVMCNSHLPSRRDATRRDRTVLSPSTLHVTRYPQNCECILTTDSVTSFHLMYYTPGCPSVLPSVRHTYRNSCTQHQALTPRTLVSSHPQFMGVKLPKSAPHTFTAVLRSTQPSTLRGTVKWVSVYGLNNNNNCDGWCG